MSYNYNPDQAKIEFHPLCQIASQCPGCERDNFEQFKACLVESMHVDYCQAVHIPREIYITCQECERDYRIEIGIEIYPIERIAK